MSLKGWHTLDVQPQVQQFLQDAAHKDSRFYQLLTEQVGDGTATFTRRLPNLVNLSIFGLRYGCRDF